MSDREDMEAAHEHAEELLAESTTQSIIVEEILQSLGMKFSADSIMLGAALYAADAFGSSREEVERFVDEFGRTCIELFDRDSKETRQ